MKTACMTTARCALPNSRANYVGITVWHRLALCTSIGRLIKYPSRGALTVTKSRSFHVASRSTVIGTFLTAVCGRRGKRSRTISWITNAVAKTGVTTATGAIDVAGLTHFRSRIVDKLNAATTIAETSPIGYAAASAALRACCTLQKRRNESVILFTCRLTCSRYFTVSRCYRKAIYIASCTGGN